MSRALLQRIRQEIMLPADIEEDIDELLAKPRPDPIGETTLSGVDWNIDPVLDLLVGTSLYAHQQKPLSDADILQIIDGGIGLDQFTLIDFARAIEKAHNIT